MKVCSEIDKRRDFQVRWGGGIYAKSERDLFMYILLGDPVSFFTIDKQAIILETVKVVSGL